MPHTVTCPVCKSTFQSNQPNVTFCSKPVCQHERKRRNKIRLKERRKTGTPVVPLFTSVSPTPPADTEKLQKELNELKADYKELHRKFVILQSVYRVARERGHV
jgi:hypothetical protein